MKTPPAGFYIDPARLAVEHASAFSRSWQLAAPGVPLSRLDLRLIRQAVARFGDGRRGGFRSREHSSPVGEGACFGPLLFAALDASTPAFEEFFPGVTGHCAPLGLERMGYVTTRDYAVNANWKVYVDNYLEGYHIPLVHPGLNRELDYR